MMPKVGFDRWGEGPQHLHNEHLWEQGEGTKYRLGGGTIDHVWPPTCVNTSVFQPEIRP